MKFQKNIIINLISLVITLLILNPCYAQTKREQTITFPGVVEHISGDFKFIVVNETKISISPDTQVVNEKGNGLTLYDLKPKSSINIEVVKNANGFFAIKIIVKTQKG